MRFPFFFVLLSAHKCYSQTCTAGFYPFNADHKLYFYGGPSTLPNRINRLEINPLTTSYTGPTSTVGNGIAAHYTHARTEGLAEYNTVGEVDNLAVSKDGTRMVFSEYNVDIIRSLNIETRIVKVLVGGTSPSVIPPSTDGYGTTALFYRITGLTFDSSGDNVYFGSHAMSRLVKSTYVLGNTNPLMGTATTLLMNGDGTSAGYVDGTLESPGVPCIGIGCGQLSAGYYYKFRNSNKWLVWDNVKRIFRKVYYETGRKEVWSVLGDYIYLSGSSECVNNKVVSDSGAVTKTDPSTSRISQVLDLTFSLDDTAAYIASDLAIRKITWNTATDQHWIEDWFGRCGSTSGRTFNSGTGKNALYYVQKIVLYDATKMYMITNDALYRIDMTDVSATKIYTGSFSSSAKLAVFAPPSSCATCLAGNYCPSGTLIACPAGTCCPAGATSTGCAIGSYCWDSGSNTCASCTNKPASRSTYTSAGTSTSDCAWSCTAAPSNSIQNPSTCLFSCNGGYYSDSIQCLLCGPGKYCPVGSTAENNCAANYYCPNTVTQINCTSSCNAGFYISSACTSTADAVCSPINCGQGYYFSINSCVTCTAGYYCPGGSVTRQLCTTIGSCASGTYLNPCNATHNNLCSPCSLGNYCPYGSTVQTPCAAGYFCTDPGTQSQCTALFYCPQKSTTPMSCPQYTWSHPGSFTITNCTANAGYYGAAGSAATLCIPNRYCPAGSTAPQTCPDNTFSLAGSSIITNCSANAGYHGTPGNIVSVCPENYFCPLGSITPTTCPLNTISNLASSSVTQCVAKVGHYGLPGASATACQPGTFANTTNLPSCFPCAKLEYATGLGTLACAKCTNSLSMGTFLQGCGGAYAGTIQYCTNLP